MNDNLGLTWIRSSVGVRARPDLCVIDVHGDDRRTWLNGQVSNDVRNTKPGDAIYALVLNVRGKILSDVWALDRDDHFSLVIPKAQQADLRAHLEQYIIMEDVTLSLRDDLRVISIHGPRSAAIVNAAIAHYACHELGDNGLYVLCGATELDATLADLENKAQAAGGGAIDEDTFERARVELCVPRFAHDFDIHHYPQEAGLKQRAVSFSKGCYLGQEVVCTLESRGKVSRRLVALSYRGPSPSVGDPIATDSGEASGAITSVSVEGDHGRVLGYVRRIHIESRTALQTNAGAQLTIEALVGND